MIELAFFLLDPAQVAVEAYRARMEVSAERGERIVCDDGANPYKRDGRPNWDCELRGCSPHEKVCWSDRLDFCFDESGEDRGVCVYDQPRKKCSSRWSCFDLWAYCNGVYKCHDDSYFGCTDGSCTPKPTVPASSGAAAAEERDECVAADSSASSVEVSLEMSLKVEARAAPRAPGSLPVVAAADMMRGHGDV